MRGNGKIEVRRLCLSFCNYLAFDGGIVRHHETGHVSSLRHQVMTTDAKDSL